MLNINKKKKKKLTRQEIKAPIVQPANITGLFG